MSFYKQNLEAFVQLLEEKPQLFTESQRQDLIALIEPLEDDIETLSVAIAHWYEKEDEIVDAQLEILNNSILLNNNSESNSTTNLALERFKEGSVPKPKQALNKETLKNAIQQSIK